MISHPLSLLAIRLIPIHNSLFTRRAHESPHQNHTKERRPRPQGKAIEGAVKGLGISGVGDVRQGKYIEVDLAEKDPAKAKVIVEQMCKDLLANTVIENYSYEIG